MQWLKGEWASEKCHNWTQETVDLWPWIRPFRCQIIYLLQDFFFQKLLTKMVQIYFNISNFRSTAEKTTITVEVEFSWRQMTWWFSICLRLRCWCFLHRMNFLLLLRKQKSTSINQIQYTTKLAKSWNHKKWGSTKHVYTNIQQCTT